MDFRTRALEALQETIDRRRALHSIAETGLFLPKTTEYIISELTKLGISYKRLETCDGIIGIIDTGKAGKTVALRADTDALPITEETGCDYACKTGNMHACGHDAHTAMLLTAAKLLLEAKDKMSGKIKLIFQPAEELCSGAFAMAAEGALDYERADAVFAQHVGWLYDAPAGTVCIKRGAMMSAQNMIKITVHGKGSHGAEPQNGIDSIVTVSNLILSLQTIISREISPFDNAVFSVCSVHAGSSYNIVPSDAVIQATLRTYSRQTQKFLLERIKAVAEFVCRAHRAECEIEIINDLPATYNNPDAADFICDLTKRLYGEDSLVIMSEPSMVSEDVCVFLDDAPGAFWLLSTRPEEGAYKNHNPKFNLEESVLHKGCAIMAQAAFEYLTGDIEFEK